MMKGKSFIKGRAYSYFVLGCILLLGVVAFYLSCKSNSPTEPTSQSSETTAVRGTAHATRTTTTSSVPAAVRSGKSQISTSTIITSRYLTTTTSTTSTTSIPVTTTTSIRGATTSIEQAADVRFCNVYGAFFPFMNGGWELTAQTNSQRIDKQLFNIIQRGETVYVPPGAFGIVFFEVKNVGDGEARRVKANVYPGRCSSHILGFWSDSRVMNRLPNDGVCRIYPNPREPFGMTIPNELVPHQLPGLLLIVIDEDAPLGECCTIIISLDWEGATSSPKFRFTICTADIEE